MSIDMCMDMCIDVRISAINGPYMHIDLVYRHARMHICGIGAGRHAGMQIGRSGT